MASSDDEESQTAYVPFRERPEFADIVPIPQDDGPHPILQIDYSAEYRDTMDYLRAVMKSDERSPRALIIVDEAIRANPGHYTAWYYRRRVIEAIDGDMTREFAFTELIARNSPKNYQLWYHRRWCVERTRDFSAELSFTARALAEDSKNYHVWTHRQWVISEFKLWATELDYVESLLVEDIRNNSAWNQRYYVISNTSGWTDDVRAQETQYALAKIAQAPHNESPWNYLRGIYLNVNIAQYPIVLAEVEKHRDAVPGNPFAWSMLLDIYAVIGTEASLTQALACCERLAELDVIRGKYWQYSFDQLRQKLSAVQGAV